MLIIWHFELSELCSPALTKKLTEERITKKVTDETNEKAHRRENDFDLSMCKI